MPDLSAPPSRGVSPIPPADTRHLPRILCLHGGGTNADIFRMQARVLIRHLPDFRLVFADGPFFCPAGPGVFPVFEDCGPFRRWLRWLPEHAAIDDDSAIDEVIYALDACKRQDEGTGPWVGLLGFSQGAKLASSLLYDQQVRIEREGKADTDYKFAVVLNGRTPLVSLSDYTRDPACVRPGNLSEGFVFDGKSSHVLSLPTIHVHGLSDPGLELHRKMLREYHDPKTASLVEWDGDHRVPIKSAVVKEICDDIYRVAKEQGMDV